jgi:recombination protein RecT
MEISIAPEKQKDIIKFFNSPEVQKKIAYSIPETMKKFGMTPQRMLRLLFNAIQTTPELATCDMNSILHCLVQCAIVGLEPNTSLGHAWIIPFQKKARFVVGYRGLLELCHRSGKNIFPMAYVVYEGDDFSFQYGTEKFLHHTPRGITDDSALTHAYAIAQLGKTTEFLVMFRSEIDYIRSHSSSSQSQYSPWNNFYSEMAKKTVLKRFLKNLPLSIEIAHAIYYDENDNVLIPELENPIIDFNGLQEDKQEKERKNKYKDKEENKREILIQRLSELPPEQLEQAKEKFKIEKDITKLTTPELEMLERVIINQL